LPLLFAPTLDPTSFRDFGSVSTEKVFEIRWDKAGGFKVIHYDQGDWERTFAPLADADPLRVKAERPAGWPTDFNIVVMSGTICARLRRLRRPEFPERSTRLEQMSRMPTPTWFVTYHPRARDADNRMRKSEQFANEQAAKVFAQARAIEDPDVTAGTYQPSHAEALHWLRPNRGLARKVAMDFCSKAHLIF